jgi:ribosomal protein S18 acetylase RimI-like enzyme
MNIRQFNFDTDYIPVIHLWENVGPGVHVGRSDSPQEITRKLERDPELFLVAEIDAAIVGTVLGGYDGRRGIMYHLAVKPEFQNMGIGNQLMSELENRLRAKGCIRYHLLVTVDNHSAIDFYEKRGWNRLNLYVYGKDLA